MFSCQLLLKFIEPSHHSSERLGSYDSGIVIWELLRIRHDGVGIWHIIFHVLTVRTESTALYWSLLWSQHSLVRLHSGTQAVRIARYCFAKELKIPASNTLGKHTHEPARGSRCGGFRAQSGAWLTAQAIRADEKHVTSAIKHVGSCTCPQYRVLVAFFFFFWAIACFAGRWAKIETPLALLAVTSIWA